MNKDVYLKDEGDFITVVFQSDKAKKAVKKQPQRVIDNIYGNDLPKLDVDLTAKKSIIAWCASHELTIEEF
jgi:hypothetical protein